nr:TPA_asm: m54.5 ORF [Murid betaherpesvirus 1]DBA08003.1 TPA_asm: m54.5 ORF [Murid betaherpesvirus 1]
MANPTQAGPGGDEAVHQRDATDDHGQAAAGPQSNVQRFLRFHGGSGRDAPVSPHRRFYHQDRQGYVARDRRPYRGPVQPPRFSPYRPRTPPRGYRPRSPPGQDHLRRHRQCVCGFLRHRQGSPFEGRWSPRRERYERPFQRARSPRVREDVRFPYDDMQEEVYRQGPRFPEPQYERRRSRSPHRMRFRQGGGERRPPYGFQRRDRFGGDYEAFPDDFRRPQEERYPM